MRNNYLLTYVQRDGIHVILFSVAMVCAGILPFAFSQDIALHATGGVAFLCAAIGFSLGISSLKPLEERSVRALKRYGPVPDVLEELQREHLRPDTIRIGRATLGQTWLTYRGIGIAVFRRDEIRSVRLQETEQRHNGLRVQSTWQVLVTRSDGETQAVHAPGRPQAEQLISLLQS